MRLFTCGVGPVAGSFPLLRHPCGVAADALKRAGYAFEVEKVKGFKKPGAERRLKGSAPAPRGAGRRRLQRREGDSNPR